MHAEQAKKNEKKEEEAISQYAFGRGTPTQINKRRQEKERRKKMKKSERSEMKLRSVEVRYGKVAALDCFGLEHTVNSFNARPIALILSKH